MFLKNQAFVLWNSSLHQKNQVCVSWNSSFYQKNQVCVSWNSSLRLVKSSLRLVESSLRSVEFKFASKESSLRFVEFKFAFCGIKFAFCEFKFCRKNQVFENACELHRTRYTVVILNMLMLEITEKFILILCSSQCPILQRRVVPSWLRGE